MSLRSTVALCSSWVMSLLRAAKRPVCDSAWVESGGATRGPAQQFPPIGSSITIRKLMRLRGLVGNKGTLGNKLGETVLKRGLEWGKDSLQGLK